MKEEQREEEKKKKIEQKMAQIDEKNDKVIHECCNSASIHSSVFYFRAEQYLCFSFLHTASSRRKGQEEGGPKTSRGARREKEVAGRGQEEEAAASSSENPVPFLLFMF